MTADQNPHTSTTAAPNASNAAPSAARPIAIPPALASIFQRRNSVTSPIFSLPSSITDPRRRLSINSMGLTGSSTSSNASLYGLRRGSVSTTSDSITDEHAVDEDDTARAPPLSPYNRRTSMGAQSGLLGLRTSEPHGFNWAEQLRAQAEAVRPPNLAARAAMAASAAPVAKAASVAKAAPVAMTAPASPAVSQKLPSPPVQAAPAPKPARVKLMSGKPDEMQERILKGDFHMD